MAKILIQHEKREVVDGKERTIIEEKQYFVADETKDFQTKYGSVAAAELAKPDGSNVKTSRGKEMIVLTPSFADLFKRIRKLPQTVMPKDIGNIIATTGIGADSIVVDAGAGSGALAAGLARVCKHVTTYERRDDFLQNLKQNFALLGLTNITLKHADVADGVGEKDVDLVTLDMPEPWKVLHAVTPALKRGGYIMGYLPTIPQVSAFVEALKENGHYLVLKTTELIERPWIVDRKKVRPDSEFVGHTAFLVFARKVQ